MLTNADIRTALTQLAEAAGRADKALGDSDELPAADQAELLTETLKLTAKLSKLGGRIDKLACPMLGPRGNGDGSPAEDKARGRKR
jgi:hypothetical protein